MFRRRFAPLMTAREPIYNLLFGLTLVKGKDNYNYNYRHYARFEN